MNSEILPESLSGWQFHTWNRNLLFKLMQVPVRLGRARFLGEQHSTWEETVKNGPINTTTSFNDVPPVDSCNVYGAHIAGTLLTDLSEADRCRIAGHIQICPACAARFQQYQFIEEFAANLPEYQLVDRSNGLNRKKQGKNVRDLRVSRLTSFLIEPLIETGKKLFRAMTRRIEFHRRRFSHSKHRSKRL